MKPWYSRENTSFKDVLLEYEYYAIIDFNVVHKHLRAVSHFISHTTIIAFLTVWYFLSVWPYESVLACVTILAQLILLPISPSLRQGPRCVNIPPQISTHQQHAPEGSKQIQPVLRHPAVSGRTFFWWFTKGIGWGHSANHRGQWGRGHLRRCTSP